MPLTLQTKLLAGAVLAAFLVLCIVNYLVTSGTGVRFSNTDSNFCGTGTKDLPRPPRLSVRHWPHRSAVANTHPVFVLPVGWAFSIWGIIYLLEGIFSIYQALPASIGGGVADERLESARPLILGIFACNVIWLFLFGYEAYWVAALVILAYNYLLFKLIITLDVDYLGATTPLKTKLLVSAGFSCNASWVTVASCLQLQVNLLEEGWAPSPAFSVGQLAVAIAIACAAVYSYADIAYAAVAVWALGGIMVNQAAASKWCCASQICPACAPGMDICARDDTSVFSGRPNGFRSLCAGWNATLDDVCVVAKSDEVSGWALTGIFAVLVALLAGMARGALARRLKPESELPTKSMLTEGGGATIHGSI